MQATARKRLAYTPRPLANAPEHTIRALSYGPYQSFCRPSANENFVIPAYPPFNYDPSILPRSTARTTHTSVSLPSYATPPPSPIYNQLRVIPAADADNLPAFAANELPVQLPVVQVHVEAPVRGFRVPLARLPRILDFTPFDHPGHPPLIFVPDIRHTHRRHETDLASFRLFVTPVDPSFDHFHSFIPPRSYTHIPPATITGLQPAQRYSFIKYFPALSQVVVSSSAEMYAITFQMRFYTQIQPFGSSLTDRTRSSINSFSPST